MRKMLKNFISNKTVRHIFRIIAISVSILAGLVVISQFFLPQLLSPVKKDLDIQIVQGLPDAIDHDLYLIAVKCKRVRASRTGLINDFEIRISALEGTIEKVICTGVIPKNQKEIDEDLESGNASSISSIEYPPIDEEDEIIIIVFVRTDGRIPRLRLVGRVDGEKVKVIRLQEMLEGILPLIR